MRLYGDLSKRQVLLPYIYEGRCNRIIKEEKTERTLDFMRRRYYNKGHIYRLYMNGGVCDGEEEH